MNELAKILDLERYKVIKIEEKYENKKRKKVIYLESKNRKDKCPICNEYTSSIHDKLRPMV